MKRTTKIAGIAAALVLPAGALAGGIAQAQSSHTPAQHALASHKAAPAGETAGRDTDNIQEGDQTGPDSGASAAATKPSASVSAKPAPVVSHRGALVAAKSGAGSSGQIQSGSQSGGTSDEGSGETGGEEEGGPSDGPGGHQDPPGDVQHEGGAGEQ